MSATQMRSGPSCGRVQCDGPGELAPCPCYPDIGGCQIVAGSKPAARRAARQEGWLTSIRAFPGVVRGDGDQCPHCKPGGQA